MGTTKRATSFIASMETDTPVARSLEQVRSLIERFGVHELTTLYGPDGTPTGVRFRVISQDLPNGLPIEVRVPVDGVYALLRERRPLGDVGRLRAKAEKIAWRHAHDFIRASLIAVQTGILSIGEAFLSSIVVADPANGTTVYTRLGDLLNRGDLFGDGVKLLPPGRG